MRSQRAISLLVTLVTVVLMVWLVWPYFVDVIPREIHKWAMLGLAIACLIPQCLFEVYFAMPFDVTAFDRSVDYEFTSFSYAFEFAALNRDAEWVKFNGREDLLKSLDGTSPVDCDDP